VREKISPGISSKKSDTDPIHVTENIVELDDGVDIFLGWRH
jgi:hypothetical protein